MLKEFINGLHFDTSLYGVEGRGEEDFKKEVEDFLDNYGIDEKRFEKAVKEGFTTDSEFGYVSYASDAVIEYADSQVDIYNSELREKAKDYADFITEAIEEYGVPERKDFSMEKLFMMGQYHYYSLLFNSVIDQLEEFIKEKQNEVNEN